MDLFQLLSKGIQFNNIKNQKKTTKNPVQQPHTATDPDLDFFNNVQTQPSPLQANELEANSSNFPNHDPDIPILNVETVKKFRKANHIRVTPLSNETPFPIQSFNELRTLYEIDEQLLTHLSVNHYHTPTPIQMQAIPIILSNLDLVACSATGSGKTLAYLLPLVHLLQQTSEPLPGIPTVCIVAPTRELALQINRHLLKLIPDSSDLKCAVLVKTQQSPTKRPEIKCNFVIATPLSLVSHINAKTINLNQLRHLVLDEADRLLAHNLIKQLDQILASCPSVRQTILFTATLSSTVESLAKSVLRENMVRLIIGVKNTGASTIDQQLVFVGSEAGKLMTIRQHLHNGTCKPPVLVFVQSIDRAKQLFTELQHETVHLDVIHSDRSEAQRDSVIEQFRLGKIWVLIATDCLARGIDLVVNTVINFDLPQTADVYIHRIGRSGRMGRQGLALTYFSKLDAGYLRSIVNVIVQSGGNVPEYMLDLQPPSQSLKRVLKSAPVLRGSIGSSHRVEKRWIVPKHKPTRRDASKKLKVGIRPKKGQQGKTGPTRHSESIVTAAKSEHKASGFTNKNSGLSKCKHGNEFLLRTGK